MNSAARLTRCKLTWSASPGLPGNFGRARKPRQAAVGLHLHAAKKSRPPREGADRAGLDSTGSPAGHQTHHGRRRTVASDQPSSAVDRLREEEDRPRSPDVLSRHCCVLALQHLRALN